MMTAESSRRALQKKINVAGINLNEVIDRLAEELALYGFKGMVELSLTVTVDDESRGGRPDVVVTRKTEIKFER